MRLLTKCPDCSIALELSIADADRRKRCPRCGKLFRLPDTDALHKALTLLQSAQCDVYVDEKGNVFG
ncbi:MAG TPA: hypothetical protein ENN97_03580 [Phycisphaerales bacterium]|nr:hypothetical protein [Phycisphaerales bacterium]